MAPVFVAWPLLRREESPAAPVAGVDAVSETLSTEEGRAAGLGEADPGEVSFTFGGVLELLLLFSTNRLNSLGDSLRTTMALGAPARLERPFAAEELAEAGMFRSRVAVGNLSD